MKRIKKYYKIFTIILLTYTFISGLLINVPRLNILNETIRSLHFHVPMWFNMIFLLLISFIYSLLYIKKKKKSFDDNAVAFAKTGLVFGFLGIITGMIWAKFTWGKLWNGDPKQNGSLITLLIYFSYIILRKNFKDTQKKAKISAIYNIFAFSTIIPLLFILPRLTDSLHPGNGGNPGFNSYDLDNSLKLTFYPSIIGWFLLGFWISKLISYLEWIERKIKK